METVPQKNTPILEIAWNRFAQLDAAASQRSKSHLRMRRWMGALGILAALLAILSQRFPTATYGLVGWILRVFLILTPLIASFLAAVVTKNYAGGDWLIKRAGAEEIRKEIYLYRTVFQQTPTRRADLEEKLEKIQRQIYRGLDGELTMEPYEGPLPSNYDPEDPSSDPGFHDLTGEEYFQYRLLPQLNWHTKKLKAFQSERIRLQVLIGVAGIVGAFLAALDQTAIWVALASAFAAAFIGWQQLRNLDAIIRNYSKVRMELEVLQNHWLNLEAEERTNAQFYKMVKSTEEILWSQNVEYIKSQQEALKDSSVEKDAELIKNVIQQAVDAEERTKQAIVEKTETFVTEAIQRGEAVLTETFEAALTGLAAEANSELVQAELASMKQAISEAAENLIERAGSSLTSSLQAIAAEFEGVEIGRDTPPAVLNQIMSRYPKSNDVKG